MIVGPLIIPGVVELIFNANTLAVLVPHMLVAWTDILPLVKPLLDTVMLLVPCPDIAVNPVGKVHV